MMKACYTNIMKQTHLTGVCLFLRMFLACVVALKDTSELICGITTLPDGDLPIHVEEA